MARLRLADIEWGSGTLRVLGKGRYEVRLPLPQDAGDTLLRYLECRPEAGQTDQVFVRNIAPFNQFITGHCVSGVVKRALRRAGVINTAKAHTYYAIPPPLRCCAMVFPSIRSAWFFAIVVSIRPPITPKLITPCSNKSLSRGRR